MIRRRQVDRCHRGPDSDHGRFSTSVQHVAESAGEQDPLMIKRADAVAEGLIDFIMARSKQHNEFFCELVRQTHVHCPKVAT